MSIENNCDTLSKRINRKKIRNFAEKHFSKKRLRNAKILILPGWAGFEIYEIWDKLGIKRSNIWGATNDISEYKKLKTNARGINIAFGDILGFEGIDNLANLVMGFKGLSWGFYKKMFAECAYKNGPQHNYNFYDDEIVAIDKEITRQLPYFDIIYLDFYGFKHIKNTAMSRLGMFLKDGGILGFTWLNQRKYYKNVMKLLSKMGNRSIAETMSKNILFLLAFFNNLEDKSKGEWFRNRFPHVFGQNVLDFNLLTNDFSSLSNEFSNEAIYKILDAALLNGIYPTKALNTVYMGGEGGTSKMVSNLFCFKKISRHLNKDVIQFLFKKIEESTSTPYELIGNASMNNDSIKNNRINSVSGKTKSEILFYLKKGVPSSEIAQTYNLPLQKVAAYKAHITMGTY